MAVIPRCLNCGREIRGPKTWTIQQDTCACGFSVSYYLGEIEYYSRKVRQDEQGYIKVPQGCLLVIRERRER